MTVEEQINQVEREMQRKIAMVKTELFTQLVRLSPVDTGKFRQNWKLTEISPYVFAISNNTAYGAILWYGRININGKTFGSLQGWGALGGKEFLTRFKRDIRRILNE